MVNVLLLLVVRAQTSTPKASGAANAALEEAAKAEAEIEAAMKKMAALEEAAIAEAEIEAATAAMAKLTAASQPEATSAPQTSSPPPPVVRQVGGLPVACSV